MGRCRTAFNAYSVKFSPFIPSRIAVSTAQNFGIIGNGKQHVFEVRVGGTTATACGAAGQGAWEGKSGLEALHCGSTHADKHQCHSLSCIQVIALRTY